MALLRDKQIRLARLRESSLEALNERKRQTQILWMKFCLIPPKSEYLM